MTVIKSFEQIKTKSYFWIFLPKRLDSPKRELLVSRASDEKKKKKIRLCSLFLETIASRLWNPRGTTRTQVRAYLTTRVNPSVIRAPERTRSGTRAVGFALVLSGRSWPASRRVVSEPTERRRACRGYNLTRSKRLSRASRTDVNNHCSANTTAYRNTLLSPST